jgi:hypothetical protein
MLAAVVCLTTSPAWATFIEYQSTNGDVQFNIGTNSMTITLTNIGTVTDIAHTLTGVIFTFSATPPAETLTGASAAGTATCTGTGASTTCTSNTTPVSAPGATPFGWTLSTSAATDTLQAGAGSFKPDGIVNGTIDANGKDGLGNAQHNPYLNGPVTFTKTFATAADANLTVTAVTFDFGTTPDTETGHVVPEPSSIFLGGTVLLLLGYAARKRLFRSQRLTAA